MMYDITWCANRTCPKAEICHRSVLNLEKEHPLKNMMLSFAGFKPDESGTCEHYWPEKEGE